MMKKIFLACFITLCVNLPSFSNIDSQPKHPNYGYIFLGDDKFEKINRKVFNFNQKVNKYAIRPVHILWSSIMPQYGIERFKNVANNIEYPKRLISSAIHRDFKNCGNETLRFLTNSTIGLGGMYDPAKTIFKLEQKRIDMDKALCKCKVKQGSYHVIPFINGVTTRSLTGKMLEWPLDPCIYLGTPITAIVKAGLLVNKTTYIQPIAKTIEQSYIDPYDISKKLFGVENYIKHSNLDDPEILKTAFSLCDEQKIDKKENSINDIELINNETLKGSASSDNLIIDDLSLGTNLIPDIIINDYNPQNPIVDAMRTSLFSAPDMYKSIWNELSIWNRCFVKRIKTNEVEFLDGRDKYRYRYILQKNKNAPLVILYPSIGESVNTSHNNVFAKIFYDDGFHVVMLGSHFRYEFIKSMPEGYLPGYPLQDSEYLQLLTAKIIGDIEKRHNLQINRKVLLGTSFGALQTLFVASREHDKPLIGINGYISINPPLDLIYAVNMLDENNKQWIKTGENLKDVVALCASKIIELLNRRNDKAFSLKSMPFSEEEARLVTAFLLHQKLSDLIFYLEGGLKAKNKNAIYEKIYKISFNEYVTNYLRNTIDVPDGDFSNKVTFNEISNFIESGTNYKIYHTLDDYFVNKKQLETLRNKAGANLVLFDSGSHLGYLYTDEFKRAIKGHSRAMVQATCQTP